ncbi:hypothetical protein [Marinimicrobium koreense]|uniref:hypothetical protein n=1 Tax=Marinimicrobium koreense TaxID=306545 RepID=UPI003F71877D
MANMDSMYDGNLISELGVKRYLKGRSDLPTSNINFFVRGKAAEAAWDKCNFGCHGPTYRNLTKPSSFHETLQPIDGFSPTLAGVIDGIRHQTVGKAQNIAGGVERTGERLMLNGGDAFQSVGREYVDRLSLLERRPKEFAKVMAALVHEKQTRNIFFPGSAI